MDFSSYLPISLLPIISKVLEKLILKKINKDLNPQDWIPHHQFGFREAHSAVQQCHRITSVINKTMENQQYCTAAFLDVSQAFDTVRHPGLLFKIKRLLPTKYHNLLTSYLNERQFEKKFNSEISTCFLIHSGVPQGSILGPILYTLYTSDLPTSRGTTLGTFSDDSAIFATQADPTIASRNLQEHLHSIEKWLRKWKIKVNESKSTHITFTLRKGHCPPVSINQTILLHTESVKYLRLHFDSRLNWKKIYCQEEKTNRLKNKRGKLANREKIPSIHRKQITSIQSDNQTNMALWNRTVVLCQQVQHNHHAEIPIKNPQSHSKCTVICNKPHSPHRLQHPLCK